MISRGVAKSAVSLSAAQCSLEAAKECLIVRVPNEPAGCRETPAVRTYHVQT
jgi:hypothetical protein